MDRLIPLVRSCQKAPKIELRLATLEQIFLLIGSSLRGYIQGRCPSQAGEDVLQETAVAITLNIDKFKGNADKAFWGWCFRIASNKINDQLRKKGAERVEALGSEDFLRAIENSRLERSVSPSERAELSDAMNLIKRSQPECAQYLLEHFILGLDYDEMGQMHVTTPNAMRMRIERCLELAEETLKKKR